MLKMLIKTHRQKYTVVAHEFLWYYQNECDELFDHTVTKVKPESRAWISHSTVEKKQQSIQWFNNSADIHRQ